ncbi:MAG: discoidin domain-containing protein [Clostridia bacterium]|nr:discoidin domain-containing protein [Clostridia bacterium]
MKKLLSIILCITLVLSLAPASFAAQEVEETYAKCSFDTYYETNQGKTRQFDKVETLTIGSVYDRYAEIRFDISSFADKEFAGAVIQLTGRCSVAGTSVEFRGTDFGSFESSFMLTNFKIDNAGVATVKVAVSDYIKRKVEEGEKEVIFYISTSSPIFSIYSNEYSVAASRPSLCVMKEEPYIRGQINFQYPKVTKDMFISDIADTIKNGHPYYFATRDEFDKIKKYGKGENEVLTEIYTKVKKSADSYVEKTPSSVEIVKNNQAYNSRGAECRGVIASCAIAYWVEGDAKYAQRAWDEAQVWIDLESWGTYQYLCNNEVVQGLAICYDWLYDWLSNDQKELLLKALKEKHYNTMYDMLSNPTSSKYSASFYRFYFGSNNHALLDNSATFMGAIPLLETDPQFYGFILEKIFDNLKPVVENWYPDSAWYEGIGYWGYTGEYMARWLRCMNTAFGTTYGLGDLECIKGMGAYPAYVSSSKYNFVINDGSYEQGRTTSSTYLLSTMSGNPALEKYTLETQRSLNTLNAYDALAYKVDVDYDSIDVSSFPKDKFLRNFDMVTFRDTWDSNQEMYCGMFVQDASETHGVMNSGTIALEALGEQWVTNPGKDAYALAGYFNSQQDGERWTYYFSRAEANGCLVMDPNEDGGHLVSPGDVINEFRSADRGGYAWTDLTATYARQAQSYKRGVEFTNDRSTFAVQDEVTLLKPMEVYSFYNLNRCDIEIAEDKKSVTVTKDNKKMRINILCDAPYEISIMNTNPLPTSPQMEGNRIIREIKRLAIHFPEIEKFNLRLEFTPYLTEAEIPEAPTEFVPIENWTLPEGEYVRLEANDLLADGVSLEGFVPANRCYVVETLPERLELKADTSKYDVSYETTKDGRAKIASMKDKATGRVTSYIVSLPKVVVKPTEVDLTGLKELEIISANATSSSGDSRPEHTLDGDFVSRWSASGRQSITYQLKQPTVVSKIAIAFYVSAPRVSYFDMEVSMNGREWTTVSVNDSFGTEEWEYYDLGNVKAKYIRYRGYGTSIDGWNSINEVKIFGKDE